MRPSMARRSDPAPGVADIHGRFAELHTAVPALEVARVSRGFGGVKALSEVDIALRSGAEVQLNDAAANRVRRCGAEVSSRGSIASRSSSPPPDPHAGASPSDD